jgi:thiamine biosynthesis protein ThiI
METVLAKFGEIALKGMNKAMFQDRLIRNLQAALQGQGSFTVRVNQSTAYIEAADPAAAVDWAAVLRKTANTFGVGSAQRCLILPKDFAQMVELGIPYLRDSLSFAKSFKVEAKRSDKSFSLDTPALQRDFGAAVLDAYPHLRVDVHNPEVVIWAEVRERAAYVSAGKIKGAGGMPVGSSGRAMLLLSGGFDSPVAGYLAAKRGLQLCAVHFQSPPYTSERALQKVADLRDKLIDYCGDIPLYVLPLTKLQEEMKIHCPRELYTILLRRFMLTAAESLSRKADAKAIITGECVGQVASQTLGALTCTDNAAALPILRPVICMDKIEIIEIARRIGTYEISELPFEDCCTVFTPKHPKTNPNLPEVLRAQNAFDYTPLLNEAIEGAVLL